MDKPLMKGKKLEISPNTVVEERILPKQKKILRFMERSVYLTAVIGLVVVLMLGFGEYKTKMRKAKTNIMELAHDKVNLKIELCTIKGEIRELREKLANLKNEEDLAKRDLELYILKKYRTIPKVVAHEVALQVVKQTKAEGVPFSLIVGLIEVESHFKPWAISKKDARGLMQVMPFWTKKFKMRDKYVLHDIETNISTGIKVFKVHLKEANNDINMGLYYYVGKDRTYANKVFNAMGRFEIFRSTLDTALRDEEIKEVSKGKTAPKKGNRPIIQ